MKKDRQKVALALGKAIKLIEGICPGIIWKNILCALFSGILPFVPIVLSARILDGILRGEDIHILYLKTECWFSKATMTVWWKSMEEPIMKCGMRRRSIM